MVQQSHRQTGSLGSDIHLIGFAHKIGGGIMLLKHGCGLPPSCEEGISQQGTGQEAQKLYTTKSNNRKLKLVVFFLIKVKITRDYSPLHHLLLMK